MPGVTGFVMVAPPSVTVPLQLVLVAVSVEDVKPKLERQAEDAPPLPAAVTVKPTGNVTVSVPVEVPWSPKESEKVTPVTPALRRERLSDPASVEPEMLKVSVPSFELRSVPYALQVVVC